MKSLKIISITWTALFFLPNPTVQADDLYIWAEENGNNVVFYFEGSIDTTGFPTAEPVSLNGFVSPQSGGFSFGSVGSSSFSEFSGVIPNGSTRTFGTGGYNVANSTTGDILAASTVDDLLLPAGYVSGTEISGSMTYNATDLATMGVDTTPDSYDTTVGDNTIHMFSKPLVLPPANEKAFENASEKSALFRGIKGLQKKARKLKKKGKKAKAKKLLKKAKKLKKKLAELE